MCEESGFIRKKALENACYYCGAVIVDYDLDNCPECEKSIIRCEICKRQIVLMESVSKCLYCETIFHSTHITEVVKMTGKCPICNQILNLNEIIPITSYRKKKEYSNINMQ